MTILNESGIPDVLPPLHVVGTLADRMPGALVVLLGLRSEVFVAQCTPSPPPPGYSASPRSPRVVFMTLEPEETPPEKGYVSSRIVEAAAGFRGLEAVFFVSGRSARTLGVNAQAEASGASRRLGLPVLAVDPDAERGAPGVLSTDLEDRAAAALVGLCPAAGGVALPSPEKFEKKREGLLGSLFERTPRESRTGEARPVVLLGSLGTPVGALEVASELERAGVIVEGMVPSGRVRDLPPLGEQTVVGLLDPNLPEAARAVFGRGAEVVGTLFPVGVDGTARFVQDVARKAARSSERSTGELGKARSVWQGLQESRNRIRGKRIFLAGDTGLEVPLARFLADTGAVVLEVGAPRLERKLLQEELQALGPDVDVVESPDWRGQIERVEKANPDVVVASPGLYGPLVARGHLCRSSSDFLRLGVHGYEGARRILDLFAATFERAETLEASVNL